MTKLKPLTEPQIKRVVKDYLNAYNYYWYWNLAGIGSFKGIPDITVHKVAYKDYTLPSEYRTKKGTVVYLEIKTEKGELSEHQLAFMANCKKDEIPYFIVRSLEDVRDIFEN